MSMATASTCCRRMAQSFPEGFKGIGALAVADEYDGAAFEVEDHGDVAVAFLHRDLIDGHIPEVLEDRPGELLLEVPLLDILDDVPRHMEMPGHVENRHVLREFEDVPFKGAGIGEAGIGKARDRPGGSYRTACTPPAGCPDPERSPSTLSAPCGTFSGTSL